MKKFALFLSMMFIGMIAFGQSVVVKSGDLKVLKEKGAYALVEIDWSQTEIDGMPVDEYVKTRSEGAQLSWATDELSMLYSFASLFAKYNKKGMQSVALDLADTASGKLVMVAKPKKPVYVDEADVKYKMVFKVDRFDVGSTGASVGAMFNPFDSGKTGGATLTGTFSVLDKASGEVLCSVDLLDFQGLSSPNEAVRKTLVFGTFARTLSKMVKKAK